MRSKPPIHIKHGFCFRNKPIPPEYRAWSNARSRCTNPNNPGWKRYGGRGITMCEEWRNSFEAFLAYMGHRPNGASLDRYPNNDGNYEPGNCRWATRSQQSLNTRRNIKFEADGKTMAVMEWAREVGISHATMKFRMKHWPKERWLEPRQDNCVR